MIEFMDFSQPEILKEHLFYWENKYNEYEGLLKDRPDQLSAEWFQRYDKIKMIHQNFSKLTEWLIDMNALNPQMLSTDNFSEFKKAIEESAAGIKNENVKDGNTHTHETNPITINNQGAKIGQQNINSTIDNSGASFNAS